LNCSHDDDCDDAFTLSVRAALLQFDSKKLAHAHTPCLDTSETKVAQNGEASKDASLQSTNKIDHVCHSISSIPSLDGGHWHLLFCKEMRAAHSRRHNC